MNKCIIDESDLGLLARYARAIYVGDSEEGAPRDPGMAKNIMVIVRRARTNPAPPEEPAKAKLAVVGMGAAELSNGQAVDIAFPSLSPTELVTLYGFHPADVCGGNIPYYKDIDARDADMETFEKEAEECNDGPGPHYETCETRVTAAEADRISEAEFEGF